MADYYNRFDADKNYDQLCFNADRILQSAEMNELQTMLIERQRGISDTLFKNGDVIRDARIIVDAASGETQCESGAIYLAGAVRGVPPAQLTIPLDGMVNVGIYLNASVVTELDDPALLNPAVGTRGYMEPGAYRLQLTPAWGHAGDGRDGDFYPIWEVEDGVVRPKDPPPNMDAMTQALARYDRDSAGGTYIVSGLNVARSADMDDGQQVYTVAEGRARISGFAIELPASRRVVYNAKPDLRFVDSEPHRSDNEELQHIELTRVPAEDISARITTRQTAEIVHGGFAGAADPLPDNTVLQLEKIWQGSTVYQPDADYRLVAGQIDWGLPGNEPAPGSTYQVTYTYMKRAELFNVTPTGFDVQGALEGTLILVSYQHRLRRIDRLCMDKEGKFQWLNGVSAEWTPAVPAVPPELLPLASVYQSWDGSSRLIADGVRMMPMWELGELWSRVNDVIEDQAELRLAVDVSGRDSGIKKGLFADPFLSDEMRDHGREQSAAIVDGRLVLPIETTVYALGQELTAAQTLAHDFTPVIHQPLRTGDMKVNPYMAFDPLPASCTLTPPVDHWTESKLVYTGHSGTSYYYSTTGSYSDTRTRYGQAVTSDLEFLRPIDVQFDLKGFGPGERLTGVTFDGIGVTPIPLSGSELRANSDGELSGKFTIPEKVPAGTKEVTFSGGGGSHGSQLFTGQGKLITQSYTTYTIAYIYRPVHTDPLAQTFTPNHTCQLAGVDLWFTQKATDVLVQLCETENGFPGKALGQARLSVDDIATDGPTRITWAPVMVTGGREYAFVVMCSDPDTALSLAELGKWDIDNERWVTSQPYQIGVLLSSSNASTWTVHQDRDLTFRLLAAKYTEQERVISLDEIELDNVTDVIVFGMTDLPSADCTAVYELEFDSGAKVELGNAQPIFFDAPYTGKVKARVKLRGSEQFAPVLHPGAQLMAGTLLQQADYISRTINAGPDSRLKVIFDALIPGGAAVKVYLQEEGMDSWSEVPYQSSSPMTAGVLEITHETTVPLDAPRVRVKLVLSGNTNARPEVRNLRMAVLPR